ncbi:hypothetical protein [Caulobacter hibisci]|uniref:hypothetical protein n=1 Tax=Caulobacter hibisci TaxID=2035993 RepID=UPI002FCDC143
MSDGAATAAISLIGGAPIGALRPLDGAWAELCRAAALPASRLEHRLPALIDTGAVPYGVIGDSHGRLLCRRSRRRGRWLLPVWSLETGASARGLPGDGRSGAGPRVRAALARLLALDVPVLVKFGQIDVEFVHVFKRLAGGPDAFDPAEFAAFADRTIERYLEFLTDAVPPVARSRVRVMSLFPPTLSDAAWREGYLNAHLVDVHGPADHADLAAALGRLEIPDLARRTALHAAVNVRLRAAVEAEGFAWGDDFAPWLGDGDVVDRAWQGPAAGRDHHLDHHAVRQRMLDHLWSILD